MHRFDTPSSNNVAWKVFNQLDDAFLQYIGFATKAEIKRILGKEKGLHDLKTSV